MDIFRLKNWTHYEPKDGRRHGVTALGFKAPAKSHTVMFLVTDIPETEPLTEEKIMAGFAEAGFVRAGTERQEIRQALSAYLIGMEDDNAIVNGSTENAIELLRSALDRICPEPAPPEKEG